MPTADSFTALGKGNGFPFCLPAVNVNDSPDGTPYEYWITLGGTKKGGDSPTQAEIDLSLANAMKLFWNYNGHTFTRTNIRNDILRSYIDLTLDVDEDEYRTPSQGSFTKPFPFPAEPRSRVCASDGWTNSDDTPLFYYSVGNQTGQMQLRTTMSVVKLYEGSTGDENNFLGYGIQSQIAGLFFEDQIAVASLFYKGDPAINPSYSPFPDTDAAYAYRTLDEEDNIPVVVRAWGLEPADSITITQQPSDSRLPEGLSATFEREEQHPQGLMRGKDTYQFRDFDFYTYS